MVYWSTFFSCSSFTLILTIIIWSSVPLLCLLQLLCSSSNRFSLSIIHMIGESKVGQKFDVSFPFFLSFNIKQVLPFVIHSGVLPFSRNLFKCAIIFSWIFVNSLIQNPRTLSGPHAFCFGGLPNCCLNVTASVMISSCFLLIPYTFFDSLIQSALSTSFTFWDQILHQTVLLSTVLGFNSFCLIFLLIFWNKSFRPLSNNLFLCKLVVSFFILLSSY